MQLGIDTEAKVLTIYGQVNLRELLNTIKMLGIDKEQWEITAEPEKVYVYQYPNYQPNWYPVIQPLIQPSIPWQQPITWCQTSGNGTLATLTTTSGTVVN